ncbi:hypothetical protein IJM86_04795 [bacterium]|nr:hypothetical protein [bacterium]
MRNLLNNPSNNLQILQERQNHIVRYQNLPEKREILNELTKTYDFSKLVTTILYKKLSPYPFVKLRDSLAIFFNANHQYFQLLQGELMNL